ncbi:MAG: hypothetical protein U0941_05840 [Planctomycetaceae bacterium]
MMLGRIRFIPTDGTHGPVAVASVKNGVYQFSTQNGPVLGRHRVEIESIPDAGFDVDDEAAYARAQATRQNVPLPVQTVPMHYNQQSILLATVDPRANRIFDFKLQKPIEPGVGIR